MTNKPEHTALPWKAELARTVIHIQGKEHGVCEISISANHVYEDYKGCRQDYINRQKANAEYIVHACNAYPVMQNALEKAELVLRQLPIDDLEARNAAGLVAMALAKARGEA